MTTVLNEREKNEEERNQRGQSRQQIVRFCM